MNFRNRRQRKPKKRGGGIKNMRAPNKKFLFEGEVVLSSAATTHARFNTKRDLSAFMTEFDLEYYLKNVPDLKLLEVRSSNFRALKIICSVPTCIDFRIIKPSSSLIHLPFPKGYKFSRLKQVALTNVSEIKTSSKVFFLKSLSFSETLRTVALNSTEKMIKNGVMLEIAFKKQTTDEEEGEVSNFLFINSMNLRSGQTLFYSSHFFKKHRTALYWAHELKIIKENQHTVKLKVRDFERVRFSQDPEMKFLDQYLEMN